MNNSAPSEISARELASWLVAQGDDVWWTVDGDPFLASRVDFPCPGDELAEELRRTDRELLVFPPAGAASLPAKKLAADDLSQFVEHLPPYDHQSEGDRVLQLAWKGNGERWLLIEDQETSESSQRDWMETQRNPS